jgi:hypothetical protein
VQPRIAEPVALPRCLGPTCKRYITHRSPSPDFCGELCWRTWLARENRRRA